LTGKTQSGNMALCRDRRNPYLQLGAGGAGARDSVFTVADFRQKSNNVKAIGGKLMAFFIFFR
jgi:hypothetical protein